jgi:hypothetical protein
MPAFAVRKSWLQPSPANGGLWDSSHPDGGVRFLGCLSRKDGPATHAGPGIGATLKRRRSEEKVVGREVVTAGQLDLHIGSISTEDVELDDGVAELGGHPRLTQTRKGIVADEGEGLITGNRSIGIDIEQIDGIGALEEVSDDIAKITALPAVTLAVVVEAIEAGAARHFVGARITEEYIVAAATSEFVVAFATAEYVVAAATGQCVVAKVVAEKTIAFQVVVAAAAGQRVVAVEATEIVVTEPTEHGIVARSGVDEVVAIEGADGIIEACTEERVVAIGASDVCHASAP